MKKTNLYLTLIIIISVVGGIVAYIMSDYANRPVEEPKLTVEKYEDVRAFNDDLHTNKKDISSFDFSKVEGARELIGSLRFNDRTKWPSEDKMPKGVDPEKILEWAKDPGLGIKKLHKKGFTGKGVKIGIIDQPIYTKHPEYAHAIKGYRSFGETDMKGGALGSAYVSILAGKNTGVAPDAHIYYAGIAMDKLDVAVYGLALDWFIEMNETLPPAEKIRLIVVPTAPDGESSPFEENTAMWDSYLQKASDAGIVILDCTSRNKFGSMYFTEDRDSFDAAMPGYPDDSTRDASSEKILVPTGAFSVAEEYKEGDTGYQYIPKGGINFTVPYAAGVVALGLQEAPYSTKVNLTRDAINEGLKQTAYKLELPGKKFDVINPAKYIDFLRGNK